MSLPKYADYKVSNSRWMGDVPSHWDVVPCREIAVEQTSKNNDALNQNYLSLMANIGVIPYEEKGDIGNKKPDDLSKCKLISKGDLVINSMNYGIGSYGLSELNGVCSPVYIVLRPRLGVIKSRFAFRIFQNRAFQTYAQSFGNGILEHRAAINWDTLKNLPVCLPPLEEQESILSFLDRETAKIDALIAEQEKLIALLAEKRQATISHAVTRGLNPHAPMKDSGVAWLGEVPAHWEVCPLKLLARIGNGSTPNRDNPAYWTDEGFPWLNSSVVNQEEVSEAERFVTPLALAECHLPIIEPPAVLVGITGQGKTRGMATRLVFTATVNQHVAYIKPSINRLTESYLLRIIEAGYLHLRTESEGTGSTKGAITCGQLGHLRLPLPGLAEQLEISSFINEETAKLSKLILESERAISLMKERRNALIAAAVTGKIDVSDISAQINADEKTEAL